MDYLCELATDGEREEALNDLPPDLNSTYERILLRVNAKPTSTQRLVCRTLRLLILSKGSLTMPQLQEALAVKEGDTSLQLRQKPNEQSIVRHCGSLIRKIQSPSGPTLELAHFTVEEFLRNLSAMDSQFAQYRIDGKSDSLDIAKICLSYLNFDNFSKLGQSDVPDDCAERLEKFPFRAHAVRFWADYAHGQDNDNAWLEMAKRFLKSEKSPNFWTWLHDLVWHMIGKHAQYKESVRQSQKVPLPAAPAAQKNEFSLKRWRTAIQGVSPLHCATLFRIPALTRWLLEFGMDVNVTSAFGCPLHCAILGITAVEIVAGNELSIGRPTTIESTAFDTIRILLDYKADVQQRYSMGHLNLPTLEVMLFSGIGTDFSLLCDCLKLLIRGGVKLDTASFKQMMGYSRQFPKSHVITMLKCFSRNDIQDSYLSSFMDYLRELNNLELLVHFGYLDISLGEGMGSKQGSAMGTRLRLASQLDQAEIVDNILRFSMANVNAADAINGLTALHIAAEHQCLEAAKVLVAHGANVNALNKTSQTPLHLCALNGNASLVELLLLHGSDPYAEDIRHQSPWTLAASFGRLNVLKVWVAIREPQEVDFVNRLEGSNSPLFVAASSHADDCVEFLTNRPEYVNVRQQNGRNLAHHCARLQLDTLKILKSRGLNMTHVDDRGFTPLHTLAANWPMIPYGRGHRLEDYFSFLISEGCDAISLCLKGDTPLHKLLATPQERFSLHEELPSAVVEMLMTDQNLNLCNALGKTVLDCLVESQWKDATMLKHMDVLRLQGAKFGPGQTPLTNVTNAVNVDVPEVGSSAPHVVGAPFIWKLLEIAPDVQDVLRGSAGIKLGLWASRNALPDILKLLLNLGLDCLKKPEEGSMCLLESIVLDRYSEEIYKHVLESANDRDLAIYVPLEGGSLLNMVCSPASKADSLLVQLLLDRGVAMNARTTDTKSTPLMLAAHSNKLDHVRILLDHNADVKAVNSSGYNILQVTVAEGQLDVLRYLVEHFGGMPPLGAPVLAIFDDSYLGNFRAEDCELIHLRFYSVDIVQYLLEAIPSLDINATTRFGDTALHLAAMFEAVDTVKLLINKGANVELRNTRQQAPLHKAVIGSSIKSVKILCENGANVNAATDEGRTPLHYAAEYGYNDIAEYLIQAGASVTKRWKGLTPEILAISGRWSETASVIRKCVQAAEGTSFLDIF